MGNENLLYHYSSFETAAAYILPSGKLQLSPLGGSRDAIESINYFAAISHMPEGTTEDISEEINNEIRENVKIVCFSKDDKIAPEEKPGMMLARMWSQYGENHKGVCLVFSRSKLEESFIETYVNENSRIIGDMQYDQKPFMMPQGHNNSSITIQSHESTGMPSVIQNKFPDLMASSVMKDILFSKVSDFSDENEYRFSYYDNSEKFIYFPFGSALKAIILGFKTTKNQEEIIKICVRNLGMKVGSNSLKRLLKAKGTYQKKIFIMGVLLHI